MNLLSRAPENSDKWSLNTFDSGGKKKLGVSHVYPLPCSFTMFVLKWQLYTCVKMMPASTLCSKIFRVKAKAHPPKASKGVSHPSEVSPLFTLLHQPHSAPCRSLNTPAGLSFLAFSHHSLLPFNLGSKASQSLGVYTNCKSFSLTRSSSFTFASTFHHRIQLIFGLFLGFIVSLLTRIQAQ